MTQRRRRVVLRLTDAEHATLTRRAYVHRLPVATYARHVALTEPVGAGRRGVDAADAWWHALRPRTRVSLHRWLGRLPRRGRPAHIGPDLLDVIAQTARGSSDPAADQESTACHAS